MKQVIVARKDLDMSAGKLAVQVAHASEAFLTQKIKENYIGEIFHGMYADVVCDDKYIGRTDRVQIGSFELDKATYSEWIDDIFTKVLFEAKNRNQIMKLVDRAKELGLKENKDFFLIKDCCLTELNPEETDENGVGRTLTCIGFRPLEDEMNKKLTKGFQLYK